MARLPGETCALPRYLCQHYAQVPALAQAGPRHQRVRNVCLEELGRTGLLPAVSGLLTFFLYSLPQPRENPGSQPLNPSVGPHSLQSQPDTQRARGLGHIQELPPGKEMRDPSSFLRRESSLCRICRALCLQSCHHPKSSMSVHL